MDKRTRKSTPSKVSKKNPKVLDLSQFRQLKIEEKRRHYERVIFTRVLGLYSFMEESGGGLEQIDIVDMSENGLKMFRSQPHNILEVGSSIPLRLYFTPSSYLKILVYIRRIEENTDRKGYEYGCEIDRDTKSYMVLKQLVLFLRTYSEMACEDSTPPLVWF